MVRTRLLPCILLLLLMAGDVRAEVVALGFPGANTAELDARFGRVLALHPAWIVILAGANDALNPAKLLAPEDSRKNLLNMISRASQTGAHVVLVTMHDPDYKRLLERHNLADYGNASPATRLAALDRIITTLAAQNSVALADFRSVLLANGGAATRLSTDGVHLTRAGYALLAATVRSKLPQRLSDSEMIVCFGDSLTYGVGVRAPGDAPETGDTNPLNFAHSWRVDDLSFQAASRRCNG